MYIGPRRSSTFKTAKVNSSRGSHFACGLCTWEELKIHLAPLTCTWSSPTTHGNTVIDAKPHTGRRNEAAVGPNNDSRHSTTHAHLHLTQDTKSPRLETTRATLSSTHAKAKTRPKSKTHMSVTRYKLTN
ncbi:hypothetical protein T440DRAFT_233028 [Plenodomus tracheiphilus IPT5]|uniref:Uncharacterized protein n=1 Tax=Plenodomus tracheiphilus IPT5 TaxID=1408161 RepID=A0A6A7ASV2_9PLEO|nr:hypothetical protein T440DRAFT_233028 [Plenodomus tracheiphilus IPT5]